MRTHLLVLALAVACSNPGKTGPVANEEACAACPAELVCVVDIGCVECNPGQDVCDGDDARECLADGSIGDVVERCGLFGGACSRGRCLTACEVADQNESNVGCEYWAVDLDNEYSIVNDAAGEQFAVAIANPNDHPVDLVVDQNNGSPGGLVMLENVAEVTVAAQDLAVLPLPQREVDGSKSAGDGPGTMLSSRAYRLRSSHPVVAYQFNPIVQSYSNGASILLPTSALDTSHWILGWPTANPVAPIPVAGLPDHSFVTIVGVSEEETVVRVELASDIVAGAGISAASAGDSVEVSLGAFDVLNLESSGIPGDFSGTRVTATRPVAVFTGGERAIVPHGLMPPAPANWDGNLCCTEHLEQQVYPEVALGRDFVITRSPIRSSSVDTREPDIYRIMATRTGTSVTTSLSPPHDSFVLDQGEYVELWSMDDFVISATHPIVVGQYLVSQTFVADPTVGGDPDFILFPPAEQHRSDYLFLTPPTFDVNWAVVAAPDGAVVTVDGVDAETRCSRHDAGMLEQPYVALRCSLDSGVHRVDADVPVGVTVYGYHFAGSYAFAAGADIKRINEIE